MFYLYAAAAMIGNYVHACMQWDLIGLPIELLNLTMVVCLVAWDEFPVETSTTGAIFALFCTFSYFLYPSRFGNKFM